jgi:hypothetical protein
VYLAAFTQRKLAPGESWLHVDVGRITRASTNGFSVRPRFFAGVTDLASGGRRKQRRGNYVIAVHSNSFRTIRGRTLLRTVLYEVAFWRDAAG